MNTCTRRTGSASIRIEEGAEMLRACASTRRPPGWRSPHRPGSGRAGLASGDSRCRPRRPGTAREVGRTAGQSGSSAGRTGRGSHPRAARRGGEVRGPSAGTGASGCLVLGTCVRAIRAGSSATSASPDLAVQAGVLDEVGGLAGVQLDQADLPLGRAVRLAEEGRDRPQDVAAG